MADYDVGAAFGAIEDDLIASMVRNLKRHTVEEAAEGIEWVQWQALQLQALEDYKRKAAAKYGTAFSTINDRIEEMLTDSYNTAEAAQERNILKAIQNGLTTASPPVSGTASVTGEFFKTNDRKLDALIKATTDDMKRAETAVLRMTDDKYRRIIFNAQVYANTGAGTYEKAVDMATRDFLSAGINCIEYKNGRRVNIKSYADMAIRTANKRAYLWGEGEMRKKWGIHTVILNKRTNPCPKCAPFVGKIFVDDVWSGGTAEEAEKLGYPLLSEAIDQGLYHPNCRDSHTTYFGEYLDEGENEQAENQGDEQPNEETAELPLKQSQQAFTQAEQEKNIQRYDAEQRENYCTRQKERFDRLGKYSLDPDNRRKYKARAAEWEIKANAACAEIEKMNLQTVANSRKSDIIDTRRKFNPLKSDKVVNILRRESDEWIRKLSSEEMRAIQKYTKNSGDAKGNEFFRRLNAMLRGEIPKDVRLLYYSEQISNALKKNRLEHDIICYRSIDVNPLNGLKVGDIYEPKQFLSTAVTKNGALNKQYVMIIAVTEGKNGAYIEKVSKYPNQREFLLDKNCKLRLNGSDGNRFFLEVL